MKHILLGILFFLNLTQLTAIAQTKSSGSCHSVYPKGFPEDAYFYLCIKEQKTYWGKKTRYAILNSDGGGRTYVAECGSARKSLNQTSLLQYHEFNFSHPRGFAKWTNDGIEGEIVFVDREQTYLTKVFSNKNNSWTNEIAEKKYLDMFQVAISNKKCYY